MDFPVVQMISNLPAMQENFLGLQNHQHQERIQLQLVLHLLLLIIIQLYHFSPPLLPPFSNSSCQPQYPSCCHVLLYCSRYYVCISHTGVSDSLQPHGLQPTRLLCPRSVHGILQARILEWVAIPFSRGSSQPRDRNLVSWDRMP